MRNTTQLYAYNDLGYGMTVTAPDGEEAFLQGDNASALLDEIEALESVWEDNGWESPNPDCFPTFEHHLDALLSQYV